MASGVMVTTASETSLQRAMTNDRFNRSLTVAYLLALKSYQVAHHYQPSSMAYSPVHMATIQSEPIDLELLDMIQTQYKLL